MSRSISPFKKSKEIPTWISPFCCSACVCSSPSACRSPSLAGFAGAGRRAGDRSPPVAAVMQQLSSGVGKVSMLTIPFFVLAGAIMAEEGGMARRLVDFAAVIVGFTRIRGGLSQVNILATTIMSDISGSSVADTSAIGSVMIPQMAAKGYPRVFATNVTISASVQAIVVPPSHNAVIYSLATGGVVSITSLFLAGVFPGLLLGFALMVLCLFYAYRDKHPKGEPVPIRQAIKMLGDATWGIVTLAIVLGGILTGVFTPIEAGAVACVWAFFVTMFIYRDYKWSELPMLTYRTLQTVAMVLTLVATASCFGYIAALMQMPAKMTEFFVAISSNKYVLLMWLNIMLLVLGTALDLAPLLLICTPILLPRREEFRHRSRAFRHRDAAKSRHRPADAAGRNHAVRRLRHRQGVGRRRHARNLAVLLCDVRRC